MCQLLLFPIRFIPADAGNSSVISNIAELNAVYPRWRGELYKCAIYGVCCLGLSPLARGTPPGDAGYVACRRFIPAGAGNSSPRQQFGPVNPVYPRWRGELIRRTRYRVQFTGLSPLARGTRKPPRRWLAVCRFIPAGAGNSLNITYY